jgi:hypothetical protein
MKYLRDSGIDAKVKRWSPWIAKLVNVIPISMAYGKEITTANWVYRLFLAVVKIWD